jgi:hypothetical protein
LQGPKAVKVYEEMRANDATVGAVFYAIESFLRKAEWNVEPGTGPKAEAEADFLRSCMDDMDAPWGDYISDILSFLVYGYSLHEVVYKVRVGPQETNGRYRSTSTDGRFGWRALALRPQSTIDRWEIDAGTGEIKGAYQTAPSGSAYGFGGGVGGSGYDVFLPMDRCVLFRTRPYKNNPEGVSILRGAYRSWFLKKRLEEIEAVGIARDLNGLPVIKVPAQIMSANASAAQRSTRAEMERLVQLIHRDECEGIVFPSNLVPGETNQATGYSIELMTTNGGSKMLPDPVIRRYDARIAMSMAAEFIILGTEKQGSFALGAEKSANFLRSLGWYVNTIAATLNNTAVKRLYDVNGVAQEDRAYICPGALDKPELMALGTYLGALASNGLLHPTPAVEAKLRGFADLPEEEEDLQGLFDAEAKAAADATAAMAAAKAPPTDPTPTPTPEA